MVTTGTDRVNIPRFVPNAVRYGTDQPKSGPNRPDRYSWQGQRCPNSIFDVAPSILHRFAQNKKFSNGKNCRDLYMLSDPGNSTRK